jgi:NADH:quinone reductase (non-electrogenic)
MTSPPPPRVVIVGAGFGGLACARALRDEPVEVLLIDRHNYHLFTPLLYQVASCLLNPSEIAAPLRKVFRAVDNVRLRVGEVTGVDFDRRCVYLADGAEIEYDELVLAAGSTTNYFGNHDLAHHVLGLKDLAQAINLRNHVLACLERAALATDAADRAHHLTFTIAGGGPTGVEYAGALAELVRLVLPHEYPEIDPHEVRIILLEGGDRLLPAFTPRLSAYARRELERRGVEVRTSALVANADERHVELRDGETIATATLVWTAGVRPSDLVGTTGAAETKSHRFDVDDHLRVRGVTHAYAIGDAAAARDKKGNELPMLSPPAMQAGRFVARDLLARRHGEEIRAFRYHDKGTLATIGRTAAVGAVGPFQFTGYLGWVVWLAVHLYYLIGFENRVRVLMRWAWYYVRYDRPVRALIDARDPETPP